MLNHILFSLKIREEYMDLFREKGGKVIKIRPWRLLFFFCDVRLSHLFLKCYDF